MRQFFSVIVFLTLVFNVFSYNTAIFSTVFIGFEVNDTVIDLSKYLSLDLSGYGDSVISKEESVRSKGGCI